MLVELNSIPMKKLILFISISFLLLCFDAHAQRYWMQQAGGNTIDAGTDLGLDGWGNTYATGYFTSTATFGTFSLTPAGVEDIYLTKLDSTGHYVWAKKAGGGGSDRPMSMKVDRFGNSYICGYFYSTATFGSYTVTSTGVQDIFIAKYDSAGTCLWVKSAGSTGTDIAYGIAIDGLGNVVVTGEFIGTATFGSFTLVSMDTTIDVFTTKLDANGNFLWVKQGAGPAIDRGLDIACDAAGNVYVTGQFTDTITFDFIHNNNMYNAIFLIKYDASGNEQWFTRAGGGTFNVARAIAIDNNQNPIITGDYTGILTFFSTSVAQTHLYGPYTNKIFIAKYSNTGNILWDTANGSDGELTAKNLAIDSAGNSYIIGNFTCKLNQYADEYGQGTFNSVGYWDIFVTKFNSSASWQWSRQVAGHGNEFGAGIAVNANNMVYITGSFNIDLIIPERQDYVNFLGYGDMYFQDDCYYYYYYNNSCNDYAYGWDYRKWNTHGNGDAFIGKGIDLLRYPYYYYIRTDTLCTHDQKTICININYNSADTLCPDTINLCSPGGDIYANTHTCYDEYISNHRGPNFHFHWSNGDTTYQSYIHASGYYSVTITTFDGCFTSTDSVYVVINPNPPIPTISDDHGINTNAIITDTIFLCADSALLTGGGYTNCSVGWTNSFNLSDTISTIEATYTDRYWFTVRNIFGCSRTNYVEVVISNLLDTIVPKLKCVTDVDMDDTVYLCDGQPFYMLIYDSLSNPMAIDECIRDAYFYWSATPSTITYYPIGDSCNVENGFTPSAPGWYTITNTVVRISHCDTDTVICSKMIYVVLYPDTSVIVTLTGNLHICPGDSTLLIATGNTSYYWETPTFYGNHADSLWATQTGYYSISVTVTTTHGCSADAYDEVYVSVYPQPLVTMIPISGLICPFDSVQLHCDGNITFNWHGPSGPVGGDTNTIYVNQPGNYYCIRTDTNGCTLVSNFVEVIQYNTPYLMVSPGYEICAGDSILLTVVTSPSATIQWLPPLSGSSLMQYVTTSGTYSCQVVCCNITTVVNATVTVSTPNAHINGLHTFCQGDSVLLTADSGMVMYIWNPGNIQTPFLWVSQAGWYFLTTFDAFGCVATDSVHITMTPPYTVPYLQVSAPDFCQGDSVLITLNTNALSTIQWQAPLTGNSFTQYVDTSGTYICSVTYCNITTTDSITVNEFIPLAHITAVGPITFCAGDSVILNANSGMTTYLWNPGSYTTQSITVLQSGSYSLTTSDSLGCVATDNISITVTPAYSVPQLHINADTLFCPGDSITITVQANSLSTLVWSSPLSGNNFTQTVYDSGIYICSVTYCNIQTSDSVHVYKFFPLALITGTVRFCDGDSAILTANTGMVTYLWNPGAIPQQSITVTHQGTYFLETSTTAGCVANDSVHISLIPNNAPILSDTVICIGSYATLNANGAPTIEWFDSANGVIPFWYGYSYITPALNLPATYYIRCHTDSCRSLRIPITVDVEDCPPTTTNIFSPNRDGKNDRWSIDGRGLSALKVKIFNRWGMLIYQWDGTLGSWGGEVMNTDKLAPDGTYYYLFTAKALTGANFSEKGFITLIR